MSAVRKVYCDCCDKEALAYVIDGQLVIADRRHGCTHSVTLKCEDLESLGIVKEASPVQS